MHVNSSYSSYGMYCAEALQRMYYYPPPLGGYYYYAWLWYDGDQHGTYSYNTWQSKIVSRMNEPAPVTTTMWGEYSAADGSGTVYAKFRNDSTASITGRVQFVITEDSIYRSVPTGDVWHNHVARDYLPTQVGQVVTIAPGDSVTLSRSFTISAAWNDQKCDILTWIQNDVMQADSTKEIWQSGMIAVSSLIGVEEYTPREVSTPSVILSPNPCVNGTEFSFNITTGERYEISIYDVTGIHIRTLSGTTSGNEERVHWNRCNDQGHEVGSGVYLYRFNSTSLQSTGKIVVQ